MNVNFADSLHGNQTPQGRLEKVRSIKCCYKHCYHEAEDSNDAEELDLIGKILWRILQKLDSNFEKRRQILNKVLQDIGFSNSRDFCASGELYFVKRYVSKFPQSVCLDVGANKGDYSRMILTESKHNVVGVEPLPYMKAQLDSLQQEYPTRFTHVEVAIAEDEKGAAIYYAESRSAHASLIQEMNELEYINNESQIHVRTIRLSTLIESISEKSNHGIILLKLDTEGFEYPILKGSEVALNAMSIPFIQIEFGLSQLISNVTLLNFHKLLPNYAIFRLTPNALLRIDPYDPISNLYYFSNYIFVHNSALHFID
jgi:FkbM family methyltransferase